MNKAKLKAPRKLQVDPLAYWHLMGARRDGQA